MRTYEALDDPKDVTRLPDGSWHVKRGARIKVRTYLRVPALRHYVALTDPLPAGFEALDTSLAVTPALPNEDYAEQGEEDDRGRALSLAEKARYAELRKMRKAASHHGYDRHRLHDDRVQAFAARLPAGVYVLEYFARSLTPGTFIAPPPVAEEIHAPETFGRDAAAVVVVERDVRSQAFP